MIPFSHDPRSIAGSRRADLEHKIRFAHHASAAHDAASSRDASNRRRLLRAVVVALRPAR